MNSQEIRELRDRRRQERMVAQQTGQVRDPVFRDASQLPPHMHRLHRKIAAATRKARELQRLDPGITEEQRRWPGLVNPTDEGDPHV